MPRIKPAVITLRDGTILRDNMDKIDYGPHLLTLYADEMQSTPVEKKGRWYEWNKKTVIQEMKQVRVPIKSWPYTAIKDIDWGYISKAQYDKITAELQKAKAEQEQKHAKSKSEEGCEARPSEDTVRPSPSVSAK